MAERIKDAEDRMLESLFAAEPVADDGFSEQVTRRINRQLWIRRLTLPLAAVIGGLIAFQPLVALLTSVSNVVATLPLDSVLPASIAVPQLQMVLLGGLLLAVGSFGVRLVMD